MLDIQYTGSVEKIHDVKNYEQGEYSLMVVWRNFSCELFVPFANQYDLHRMIGCAWVPQEICSF